MQLGGAFNKKELQPQLLQVRNQREDLVSQIMDLTTLEPERKKQVARMLMIQANTYKWTVMDLHAVLNKRSDPAIYNFTGYIVRLAYPKKVLHN